MTNLYEKDKREKAVTILDIVLNVIKTLIDVGIWIGLLAGFWGELEPLDIAEGFLNIVQLLLSMVIDTVIDILFLLEVINPEIPFKDNPPMWGYHIAQTINRVASGVLLIFNIVKTIVEAVSAH